MLLLILSRFIVLYLFTCFSNIHIKPRYCLQDCWQRGGWQTCNVGNWVDAVDRRYWFQVGRDSFWHCRWVLIIDSWVKQYQIIFSYFLLWCQSTPLASSASSYLSWGSCSEVSRPSLLMLWWSSIIRRNHTFSTSSFEILVLLDRC